MALIDGVMVVDGLSRGDNALLSGCGSCGGEGGVTVSTY